MKQTERDVLEKCLKNTADLFKRRPQSESWANNLIEGSRILTTKGQWKHFYTWIANPTKYCFEEAEKTTPATEQTIISEYSSEYDVKHFKNGCETIIHVTKKKSQDDEKTEE